MSFFNNEKNKDKEKADAFVIKKDTAVGITSMSRYDEFDEKLQDIKKKQSELIKAFSGMRKTINKNAEVLETHIKNHKEFEKQLNETHDMIFKYVKEQLLNFKMLEYYVEQEILTASMEAEISISKINALYNAHWWQKILKKQRNKIFDSAEKKVRACYEPKIALIREKQVNVSKEIIKEMEQLTNEE